MKREIISKASRNEFREVLSGFVLREIEMIFESAGISAKKDFQPAVTGQRRTLVEQYYASLDHSSVNDARRLTSAFEELIEQLCRFKEQSSDPERTQRTIDDLIKRMARDGFRYEEGHFLSDALKLTSVEVPSLLSIDEASILEHVEKARSKIEIGDNAGAISSAYTLVETFLKELLKKTQAETKLSEGDIRKLYNEVSKRLNLNPAGEGLESYLRGILQGLKDQISGFYDLANKAGDRHARRYNPARRHAQLTVNAAFTLCEFLLGSYEYQHRKTSNIESGQKGPTEA